jgi:predicted enzyme related to lactoylglutathione lyase
MMTPHGSFHWNELMTRDVETAKRFYEQAIGWTFEGMPMEHENGSTYWVAMSGGKPVGGIFDTTGHEGMENIPENWFAYLAVDDIDKRCRQAEEAGGSVVRGPFDVAGVGRIAILRQPGGGMVGWMTPVEMPNQG